MLSKFFTRKPQAGKPLALRGMAAGLAGMDNAWATMTGEGCEVSWSQGTPTIVIESGATGDGWVRGGSSTTNYGSTIGSASGIDAIHLTNRELVGGAWAVTDTTPAGSGVGCLTLSGGLYAGAGAYVVGEFGEYAAEFHDNGSFAFAKLADAFIAGLFEDVHTRVTLASEDNGAGLFEDIGGGRSVGLCPDVGEALEVEGSVNISVGENLQVDNERVVQGRGGAVSIPFLLSVPVIETGADEDQVARVAINVLTTEVHAINAAFKSLRDELSFSQGGHGLIA